MSVVLLLFVPVLARVQSQALQCKADSCAGHARDVNSIDTGVSINFWIAPDDMIVTQIPNKGAISCPTSNLRATVTRALRLTARRVVLRPLCREGLVLYKTRLSVLVDPHGPTYCALLVSSADQLHLRDITFDHSECINETTMIRSTQTADSTAAIVLQPHSSRLDSDTALQNLTFATRRPSVAVLLSPPAWDKTLQLDGPTFIGLRGHIGRMRFIALLLAGLDHPIIAASSHSTADLWQDMNARVLTRLCRAIDSSSLSPSMCPPLACSTSHMRTLLTVAFSLVALLAVCVVILLVHSCRSTEAEDLAPYRVRDPPFFQGRVQPTT